MLKATSTKLSLVAIDETYQIQMGPDFILGPNVLLIVKIRGAQDTERGSMALRDAVLRYLQNPDCQVIAWWQTFIMN